jgi:hypothetical protein
LERAYALNVCVEEVMTNAVKETCLAIRGKLGTVA